MGKIALVSLLLWLTSSSLIAQKLPVTLQLAAENMQERVVRGEPVDADQLIRVSSTSKRLLGIIASRTGKRKPAAGPTLAEYLAARAQTADAQPDEAADAADEPETADGL